MKQLTSDEYFEIRMNAGLNRQQFAKLCGITKQMVMSYETGKIVPTKTMNALYFMIKQNPKNISGLYEASENELTKLEQDIYEEIRNRN